MGGLFFPAASHPQRWIEFHPRLGRTGRGWRAVWRAAGCPVWCPGPRTPPDFTLFEDTTCPRSWQKAIKDQPRADRIPEQRLAASQEYRAASEQRKDVPSPDRGKDCGFLNSFCFRPRPGVAHPVPRGIQTPGGPGNEPYRGHSGDADPPGGLWVPLGVLAHARPTATIGEKAVRDQEGLEMKTPQILIGDIPKKWPQRRAHGKFSYISSWILGVELGRNLGGQLVHSPTICRNLTFIPPWTDGRFTFP